MFFGFGKKSTLPTPDEALKGRAEAIAVPDKHFVNGNSLKPPYPEGMELALFGLGCFWGAERQFWKQQGVYSTAVGYAAGVTPNPTYEEVCSGMTGHNEVLKVFWESHNPTQGMRQGNDSGTQYRSGIYTDSAEQHKLAEMSRDAYQQALSAAGHGTITTEILEAPEFYYAEAYHQQYLAKNPNGYCGLGGMNVTCPIPLQV
jgi:peptide-methionine (S)-S-oxide reductase